MSGALIDLLLKLSARERRLLGLMAGVALPLGIAFGVLLPLQEARRDAEAARAEAIALNSWTHERAAEAQALTRPEPEQSDEPIGLSGIEEGLVTAGLRGDLSAFGTEAGGMIELRFDQVDFLRLSAWLGAAHPDWGYQITHLRFEDIGRPARARAQIELQPVTK